MILHNSGRENLVGNRIAQFELEKLIHEGFYAQVYVARDLETGQNFVIKMSAPPYAPPNNVPLPDDSQALQQISGALLPGLPDPRVLLEHQYSIFEKVGIPCPKTHSVIDDSLTNRFGYSIELLRGPTLGELISSRKATINDIIAVAEALSRFLLKGSYHGDLKPSNIIIQGSQARFLDPGYFGRMKRSKGDSYPMMITTPLYYPLLEPDDLLAIGLIAWEVICGRHPLRRLATADPPIRISSRLEQFLQTRECYGHHYFSQIARLSNPERLIPVSNPVVLNTMLRLLRLSIEGDTLDLAPGYGSSSEVVDELKELATLL